MCWIFNPQIHIIIVFGEEAHDEISNFVRRKKRRTRRRKKLR
jgi:hypothetical protein